MSDHAKNVISQAQKELADILESVNQMTRAIEVEPLHDDNDIADIYTQCKNLQTSARRLNQKMTDFIQES